MPGFLLDLDGTLYHGDRPIPGAAEFIQWLKKQRYPYLYVTNNSSRTPEQVAEHLGKVGIEAEPEEVLTTSQAAAMYMKEQGTGSKVYMIGETGLERAMLEAGFSIVTEGPVDFVVQGIDRSFNYEKLAQAVSLIRAGAGFVLTNPDHLLPWNHELRPGAGSIGAAIERASQTEPVVIGKPSPIIMNYAIRKLGLPAEQIWVVGDNLRTDIRGGVAAHCRTALVLTGLITRATLEQEQLGAGVQPELVCDSLAELADKLSQQPGRA
ncbi:TIGR01457 family HAD-type hydrolase [Paenibacillus doosanensis]|uniref:Acid sugar phosphatase n=1 Tax=Paenibacillus konkukensis TaxID=2020716 RepID=A0ABY4RV46_9BACL|nr:MULTISPECIES: TIGR01457 family HAD-type hydrolase [Paenibacillus]MCS7458949.1 TIGR01457 family HAD-type hydrolase [Paenibacillus doosanensis]UQZ86521.1 putative hydrolase YutF [Paenibacillus konkukensis]